MASSSVTAVPGDSRGKRVYELTDAGRAALAAWIELPVSGRRLKDEFFMKFVVVASAHLAEPKQLIEGQRREYLQSLRDLNALLEAEREERLRPSSSSRGRSCI